MRKSRPMLRLIVPITICLSAGFILLGGMIARQWGWDEYASDDLYVIYAQTINTARRYFIVSDSGGEVGTPLTWTTARLSAWTARQTVGCSPSSPARRSLRRGRTRHRLRPVHPRRNS
ncbi:MAG: hypothetical protein U0521_05825 [Anaerolineae bacterium]